MLLLAHNSIGRKIDEKNWEKNKTNAEETSQMRSDVKREALFFFQLLFCFTAVSIGVKIWTLMRRFQCDFEFSWKR